MDNFIFVLVSFPVEPAETTYQECQSINMADQFSDKQIDEFKEAFTLFDRNKDGTVYIAQVELVLKALGIHANEVDMRVRLL